MPHIGFDLSPEMLDAVKRAAKKSGRNVSAFLRALIKEHVRVGDGPLQAMLEDAVVNPEAKRPGGYTYLVRCGDLYKIGRSKDVGRRLVAMSLPRQAEVVASVHCVDYGAFENALHTLYARKRVNGEWFSLDERDVEAIKALMAERKA